jgi:hypothetical protein
MMIDMASPEGTRSIIPYRAACEGSPVGDKERSPFQGSG